jgi:hypothetical protein
VLPGGVAFLFILILIEYIIWSEKPELSVRFTKSDIFLIPFSLFICLFALFFEFVAITGVINFVAIADKQNILSTMIFSIIGLIVIYYGYYLSFGRFKYKIRKNSNTYYALTNMRALILYNLDKKTLKTTVISTLKNVLIFGKKNNIGSIFLGSSAIFRNLNFNQKFYGNTGLDFFIDKFFTGEAFVFYDIEDVEDVAKLIDSISGMCNQEGTGLDDRYIY